MAKPDPALLDPARYPFHCQIAPRFGDLDFNRHINNVALAGILEEGRVAFHRGCDYDELALGYASMVVNFAVDYLGQGRYPRPLDMHVACVAIGRTSYTLGQLVTQGNALIAYSSSVLACTRDGEPAEHPQAFRDAFAPWTMRS